MRFLFLALILFLVLIGSLLQLGSRKTEPSPVSGPPPAVQGPGPRKILYAAPRRPITVKNEGPISGACQPFWDTLRGLDLTDKNLLPPKATGCDQFPPELSKWHDLYVKYCAQMSQSCEQALYSYRAALTEFLTAKVPLADITDPKVLVDKMMARLQSGASPASVAEAAERLQQVDPGRADAARASVMSRLEAAQGARGKPDDPLWKRVDEALDRASRVKDDLRPYLETRLYAENLRYGDPSRLRASAAEIGKTYPTYGVGPYHEAWAEYQSGNLARSLQLVEEALRREPNNPYFRATLDGIRKGETLPFQVNLSFQLDPANN